MGHLKMFCVFSIITKLGQFKNLSYTSLLICSQKKMVPINLWLKSAPPPQFSKCINISVKWILVALTSLVKQRFSQTVNILAKYSSIRPTCLIQALHRSVTFPNMSNSDISQVSHIPNMSNSGIAQVNHIPNMSNSGISQVTYNNYMSRTAKFNCYKNSRLPLYWVHVQLVELMYRLWQMRA